MKRFPELARRGVALALAASMSLSVFMPGALAADLTTAEEHDHDHDHVHLAAENSVDALGNEDLSDETDDVPDDSDVTYDVSDDADFTAADPDADAADHTWGEWYDGTYQEGEDGEIQNVKIRICSDCGVLQLEDGTVLTPSTDKKLEIDDPDEPEWLMPGVNLDGNYDDQIAPCDSVGSHDGAHQFDQTGATNVKAWYKRPTCTSDGSALVRCSKWWHAKVFNPFTWKWEESSGQCDYSETHTIWAYGHAWGAWTTVTEATCGADGLKKRVCGRDGSHVETEPIPATGKHDWGEWTTVEATCTTPGKKYRTCKICQKEEVDDTYAANHPATGHQTGGVKWTKGDNSNVGWVVNQPYPCADGTKTRECDICHEKETVTVPATKDHKYDEFVSTTQPYPCQPGTETWKCTVCGATTTKAAKVADHSYGVWYDDYEYGCQTQNESRVCLVCTYKETRNSGKPSRAHKYTHYTMSTPDRWVTLPVDISSLHLPEPVINALAAIGVKFDENKTHILVTDNLPTPIVRADCDYGCSAHDEINAVDYPKFAAQAFAATEASKSVAGTAVPLIQKALAETKAAVNNAQSREEAIAALDQIYNVARQKILDKGSVDVGVHLAVTGIWPANYPFIGGKQWTVKLYDGAINVPLSEEIVDPALSQLKAAIDDAKEMLNNSFLSEDAVKVAINKIVDTVAGDSDLEKSIRELSFYPIYKYLGKEIGGRGDNWPNQPNDSTPTETGELILRLADSLVKKDPNAETDAWQEFLNAIFDNLVDMLIEELKKDEEYSKYLNNALGDELLEELRPKLREELVNDTTFVDTIRDIASKAIENAAHGVKRGWSDERVLANLREDLMKVQDPVEQEMLDLSATIGDLVESSLAEKINKLLPFGDLTSWIGKWVGAFAKDKAVSEVVGETGKVRQTIELYIKYITCGKHDPQTRIAQQASCTNNEMTERYCSKCGWVFEKYKTGDAWGHTPVTVKGYDATETADGLTDGIQCARCGAWLEPQEVIPAQEPQYEKYLVKSAVTTDTAKAAGYKNQKKLDEAIDAALTKAGYQTANSERFLAQVQTSIGILSNDRYPEDGVTGMVKLPAGAAGKNCTFYAVQVLTADTHGYSAGDVVITPLTVTSEGISFKLPVQSVVAIAWKVNE